MQYNNPECLPQIKLTDKYLLVLIGYIELYKIYES